MTDSILTTVKKNLGLAAEYDAFDTDIIMNINAVFSVLNQLGTGPNEGFSITDSTAVWSDFSNDPILLNAVKSYITLRVRQAFDPPSTSFHLEAIKEQIREFEWRISIQREEPQWPVIPTN